METNLRTTARNNVDALIRESKMISDIITSITEYVGECLKEKLRTPLNEAIERQKKVDAFCRQHFRPYNL